MFMKKLILFFGIFACASYNAKAQMIPLCGDYSFSGNIRANKILSREDIQIGEDQSPTNGGFGKKLYFGTPTENTDDIYMYRFNVGTDQSELRVNVGDDNNDKFVVGRKFWDQPNFTPMFSVETNRTVRVGDPSVAEESKLIVNGPVIAKKVEVKTNVWADFVFTKDYQLPTLNEVKLHIDANKHLPGIPTEAEVKEKGVDLGEMQIKLLQKIEELTLYVIQQQETIDELKSQMNSLKNGKE
jgi:hypothetical protein